MTQPPPADDEVAGQPENDEPAPGWWTVSRRRQGRNEGVGYETGDGTNDGVGSGLGDRAGNRGTDGVGYGVGGASYGWGSGAESVRGDTMRYGPVAPAGPAPVAPVAPGGMVGAALQHAWASGLDFAPGDEAAEPDYYLDPGPVPARHRRLDDDEMPVPVAVLAPAVSPPAVSLPAASLPAVSLPDASRSAVDLSAVSLPDASRSAASPPEVDDVDYRGDEDTDPIGFAPVSGPPTDPFYSRAIPDDDQDPGFILPGWGAPPPEVEERMGRVERARKPLLVAGLALFLAGLITAILFAPRLVGASEPTEAAAMPGTGTSTGVGVGRPAVTSIKGAVDGVTAATFDLVDGAGSVRMRAAELGADLYRVTTPTGSDVTPRIERNGGRLRLYLPHGSKGAPEEVNIELNAGIRWTLRLDGGAEHKTVDLTEATVDAVDLGGGARTIELALPAPKGRMPVRMAGGVDQFRVTLPGATPVRVRVQSGAGAVTLPGSTYRGIAPGRSFTANGWGSGATGVDVLAEAGMATLTVTAV